MRSKLALILAALVLPLRGEGQERQGGAWQLTTSRSAAPDQPSVTLELDALNVVRAAVVTFRPALYLRCLNDKLEAFVATGATGTRNSDYRMIVHLRWGDRPPAEETWSRSTDYSVVFAPDPVAFLRQLLATPDMTFEVRPDNADPFVARFDGAGLGAYLATLQTRCPSAPARGAGFDSVYAETQVDEKAELISMPDPEYPPLLRRAGIRGSVSVQAVVDTLGRVVPGSLRVISSANAALDEPALKAVGQSIFRPARVQGHAVRTRLRVPVKFTDGSH